MVILKLVVMFTGVLEYVHIYVMIRFCLQKEDLREYNIYHCINENHIKHTLLVMRHYVLRCQGQCLGYLQSYSCKPYYLYMKYYVLVNIINRKLI